MGRVVGNWEVGFSLGGDPEKANQGYSAKLRFRFRREHSLYFRDLVLTRSPHQLQIELLS